MYVLMVFFVCFGSDFSEMIAKETDLTMKVWFRGWLVVLINCAVTFCLVAKKIWEMKLDGV